MKFVHIFETKKKRTRGITVAYESVSRVPTSPAFYDVTCGVAYCAPVEKNYSRSLGRKISSNRLACNKNLFFDLPFLDDGQRDRSERRRDGVSGDQRTG